MALEPITRQEKIIAGQDLTPITRMEKFLKQYGGGSGGVTSWNDLTDKPFGDNADGSVTKLSGKYVEGMGYVESTKTVIAEESELIFVAEQDGISVFQLPIYDSIFEDLEAAYDDYSLRIVWDGVEYNPNRSGSGSSQRIGNDSILSESEPDTGEPFVMGLGDGMFLTKSTEATHTVAIYTATETIHPIDKKYLPSSISNLRVFITMDENENYLSSHSYAEIKNHVLNGGTCDCAFGTSLFHLTKATFLNDVQTFDLVYEVVFANVESDTLTHVSIRANGRVYVERYALSLQEV